MADAVIEGKQGQDDNKQADANDAAEEEHEEVSEDSLKNLKDSVEGK